MAKSLTTLVDTAEHLVSLPEVVMRVNELVDDRRSSAYDIGRLLEQDVALTARLLKIVNSPYYGFPSTIDTVSRAIAIMGTQDLRDLVLATAAVPTLTELCGETDELCNFWQHSLYCAVVARLLAERRRDPHPERLFVAGLLHDIGWLLMYHAEPELVRTCRQRFQPDDTSPLPIEHDVFGYTHADAGAELARRWRLPDSLIACIQDHHEPIPGSRYASDASIVHIANCVATPLSTADMAAGPVRSIDQVAWSISGLSSQSMEGLATEAAERATQMRQLLLAESAAA